MINAEYLFASAINGSLRHQHLTVEPSADQNSGARNSTFAVLNQSPDLTPTPAPFPGTTWWEKDVLYSTCLAGSNPNWCLWIVFLTPGTQHCRETSRACRTSSWPHCWWTLAAFLVKDCQELVAGKKLKRSLHNSPSSWAPILCFLKVSNEWYRSRRKEAERITGTKMDSGLVAVPCN